MHGVGELWGKNVELRGTVEGRKAQQWLADVSEDLEVIRYPTRRSLVEMVDDAARRAESRARLEYALLTLR
jgi:hypothetical protein